MKVFPFSFVERKFNMAMKKETSSETVKTKEAKIPEFKVKEESVAKTKSTRKTTQKQVQEVNVNTIVKYRTCRKNRRCRFCKNLIYQQYPAPLADGWFVCTAKDKQVHLWAPRVFCSCYDLKDVKKGG